MARSGFALVEVLVAALLLAIGAVGVAGALRTSWRALGAASAAQSAIARFADLAEELRAVPAAERATVAAEWQSRAGPGAVARPGIAADGIESWEARLAWPDPALAAPLSASQSIAVLP